MLKMSKFHVIAFAVSLMLLLITGEKTLGSERQSTSAIEPSFIPKTTFSISGGNSPRTLLNANDITRMKSWAAKYSWAADLRDQIISNANAWPAHYLADYNLTNPDLPPDGGYAYHWYVCPDGTLLEYVPTHSPPHYCPTTGQYYASPPQWPDRPALFDQVIYELQHFDLAQYAMYLGLSYQLTGNINHANGAADILRRYSTAYLNYPLHTEYTNPSGWEAAARATAQTLDEARWLINLAWAYDLIIDSGNLTYTDQEAIADGLFRPAITVIRGNDTGISNWQTWHNTAMAITALILDDQALFADTFNNPNNGFFAHLAQGASADGFWWENSWGYHFYALNALIYMAEMGERAGLDPYAAPNLRMMFLAPLQMVEPDLNLPPFNDGPTYPLATGWNSWVYEAGYNHYRDPNMLIPISSQSRTWQALLWGVETLPNSSTTAPKNSVLLPQAGYAVLRTSSDDPLYIALDFGPHGGWHGHYDKLGYISFGLGKSLGTDPGQHYYNSSLHDGWDRTTVAHNTVVVDEQNQAEATGNLHRFVGLPALSLVSADAGFVYPDRATMTRTMALTADYWLDVTRVANLDKNSHRYDWIYHNPGNISSSLTFNPYSLFPISNGYNYLTNPRYATTSADWQATWDLTGLGKPWGFVAKSSPSFFASFTLTDTTASSGLLSGQMDYDFGTSTDGWILYGTPYLDNITTAVPSYFDIRLFGDGSNHPLTLKIEDATGEGFGKWVKNINWVGWQTVGLPVDNTWWHDDWGNNDGIIDPPLRHVFVGIDPAIGASTSGRLFVDDLALTFPGVGRQIIEDFDSALAFVQMTMLGATNTTIILGDGIDSSNQAIPFAMARRQDTNTTFTTVFEPFRQSPHITSIQTLSVTPGINSASGYRINATGLFTDTLAILDDIQGDRTFGNFTTDAAIAYLRQTAMGDYQTLAIADATKLSDSSRSLITSTTPITLQLTYVGDMVYLTLPTIPTAQLRLYAPASNGVLTNNIPTPFQREGQYILINLPPEARYIYLPLITEGH